MSWFRFRDVRLCKKSTTWRADNMRTSKFYCYFYIVSACNLLYALLKPCYERAKESCMQKPCLVFVLAAFSSAAAFAQTATVLGTVTDPSGAIVPTATITITNTATSAKRVIQTNSTGNYVAPDLPIGPYAVSAESAGFKRYERTGLTLDSNDVVRVDAVLQVGQISESVTVAAEAVKIESDSSEISDLISGAQVQELAINGRHMAALAILTPGASSDFTRFQPACFRQRQH